VIDKALKASTQEHLDIYTVVDHLAILKDGSVAMVMKTSAINFMLLSESEQDATIYAYASLLNSLSFPIQILIRSSRKDISSYLDLLDEKMAETQSQKIKEQLVKYRAFIKDLVKENRVLEKHFYVVIPFSSLELGLKPQQLNPLAKPPQKPPYQTDYILNKAKMVLYPRRDHLIRQFARVGLKTTQLSTTELLALYYQIYNPDAGDGQAFTLTEAEPAPLQSPEVEPTPPQPANIPTTSAPTTAPEASPAVSPQVSGETLGTTAPNGGSFNPPQAGSPLPPSPTPIN
jgi:hypothetical protein